MASSQLTLHFCATMTSASVEMVALAEEDVRGKEGEEQGVKMLEKPPDKSFYQDFGIHKRKETGKELKSKKYPGI